LHTSGDPQGAGGEVDVVRAESAGFAAAQAEHEQHRPQRVQVVIPGGVEERAGFLGRQRFAV